MKWKRQQKFRGEQHSSPNSNHVHVKAAIRKFNAYWRNVKKKQSTLKKNFKTLFMNRAKAKLTALA